MDSTPDAKPTLDVFVPTVLPMVLAVPLPPTNKLPISRRVLNKSLPVKLVLRTRRTRSPNITLDLPSLRPPEAAIAPKITSPLSLVVVENRLFSNLLVWFLRSIIRPRRALSCLLTLSAKPAAIISLILSKQEFTPAANS